MYQLLYHTLRLSVILNFLKNSESVKENSNYILARVCGKLGVEVARVVLLGSVGINVSTFTRMLRGTN